jgi:hypothetical protein
MAYIGEDRVLLFGGYKNGGKEQSYGDTWLFDLSENTWTELLPDPHPSPRNRHDMVYVGDDQVLLFGGYYYSNETWLFDLSENTWTQLFPDSLPQEHYGHRMARLGGDQALVWGGWNYYHLDETWVYDVSDSTWTEIDAFPEPATREYFGMSYTGDDQAVIYSGWWFLDDHTWVYDLSDSAWTQIITPQRPSPRHYPGMGYVGGDKVLMFAGQDYEGTEDDTWIFDRSEETWTELALTPRPAARSKHDAAHIGDNLVLIFGGRDSTANGYLDDTWIYEHTEPSAPEVTVLQPNGGEFLTGSTTITWTATDADPGDSTLLLVDLDYSDSGGGTWMVIDSNQVNDGAFLWDISDLPDGTNYQVRATATDPLGKSHSDQSDASFSIDNTPHPPIALDDVMAILIDTVISLSWTEVTEDTAGNDIDVMYYIVYRGDDPGFSPGPSDSIGSSTRLSYNDSTAAVDNTGLNHYYLVKAVDALGGKSIESNRVAEFDHYLTRVK